MTGTLRHVLFAMLLLGGTARASELILREGETSNGAYAGSRDVLISEEGSTLHDPSANYNGFDNSVDGDPGDMTTLIRWELEAASIPSGAIVQSASLTLQISNASVLSYDIYEALVPWSAEQATWDHARTNVPWATPGAQAIGIDRGSVVLGSITGDVGSRTFALNAAGVAIVQRWLDTPSTNFGLVIQDHASTQWDAIVFRHSAVPEPAHRPRLTIVTATDGTFEFQNGAHPGPNYTGNSDTTLALAPDNAGNANRMGLSAGKQPNMVAFLSFDLSPLPARAVVTGAALLLDASEGANATFTLYPALRPWSEDAGWATYDGVLPWAAPGASGVGDLGTTVLGTSKAIGVGPNTIVLGTEGIARVQAWHAGTEPNFGFALVNRNAFPRPWFADREDPVVSRRPALRVTYVAPLTATIEVSSAEVSSDAPVQLDGSRSAPTEGAQLTGYLWRQLEGPTGLMLGDGPTQAVSLEEPGVYVFELRVQDSTGAISDPATVTLTRTGPAVTPTWSRGCSSAGPWEIAAPLLVLPPALRLRSRLKTGPRKRGQATFPGPEK